MPAGETEDGDGLGLTARTHTQKHRAEGIVLQSDSGAIRYQGHPGGGAPPHAPPILGLVV